ncbi:N-formylglutamate deformylase [Bartonella sp. HY761]|uniref:N-formylglutamate deformylase n=1 Tax=Bartonella sp. HY761 TaxID=2979330 RepID=UPI0021E20E78|nr:N-formylglutamate deformylase [Bartonella sp. HY761]UXN08065.1 N-formylglutamate deformylase [Bartonella sp. HY761]
MDVFEVKQGTSPLILAFPHTGTFVPDDIAANLNDTGRLLTDTDWHIHHLYDGLVDNATTVRALFHRYCIDANRDPLGVSLYPGQNTTSLVPLTDFDGKDIWTNAPDMEEVERRKQLFHTPYHNALADEIARVKAIHGYAILYDCHSIRSHIPFLFDGILPDFNVGTNEGQTTTAKMEQAVMDVLKTASNYSHVLNGRFKGGWTTRHYGKPQDKVFAIQMELAQSTHLQQETLPFAYDETKAKALRTPLKAVLEAVIASCA